jgi:hypothetical protein
MIYENEYIRMERTGDLIIAEYKANVFIDLDEAMNIVDQRNKLANEQPHYVIVKGGPINIAPKAKSFALSADSNRNLMAMAILEKKSLFKTSFLKILFFTLGRGNFLRFFDTKTEALEWIDEHRKTARIPKFHL